MNLNYTRVLHFLTIVKHMNMNKAAKELYISQPALSLSISRLEKELGLLLFYRDKNKLVLSKEADSLLPRFEQFRQVHDMLVNDAANLARPHDEYVNISFSGSVFFFPVFYISGFFDSFSEAVVKVSYVNIDQATSMLLTNQTDFALSYYPIIHPLISTFNIMSEPIGLVLSKSHPLASSSHISLNTLEDVQLHGLTRRDSFRTLCDRICQLNGARLSYVTEDEYAAYYKRMSQSDDNYGFLSTLENFELNFAPMGHYVFLHLDNDDFRRNVGISYLSSGKKQYKYKEFLDYVMQNFPQQSSYVSKLSRAINKEFINE